MDFKKKLYKFRPKEKEQQVESWHTKTKKKVMPVTSISVERDVRQLLADKVSGNYVGLWLLVPEHLRLGSWDLLKAWSGVQHSNTIQPRLALQMVHESALCANGVREQRTLHLKGFELLNGLPFVAADSSIHELLSEHTMAEAHTLQIALGKLRQAMGHYPGQYVLIDPHRIHTWSQREMQPKKANPKASPKKTIQTFFAVEAQSSQPLSFGMGSSSVTITQATLPLIERLDYILPDETLLIADSEHFTADILATMSKNKKLSILIPTPRYQRILKQAQALNFIPQWCGYAVAESKYQFSTHCPPLRLIVQRTGETEKNYDYKAFVTTSDLAASELMSLIFPLRWNIEEFFNIEGALGWNRAATLNLNIRFARISFALIAQALIYQMKQKLPEHLRRWNAHTTAENLFKSIDGDIRVKDHTIVVTFYDAPEYLRPYYENLPQILQRESIDPRVPWLYDFMVDFRFK